MAPERLCHTEECEEEAAEGEDYCEGCCEVILPYQGDLNKARERREEMYRLEGLTLTLDVIHGRIGRKMYAEGRA